MKKFLLTALMAVSVTGFTGCQTIEKASSHISGVISKQQEDLYNNMVNTHIRDAFFYNTRNESGNFEIHLAKPLVAANFHLE